MPEQENPGPGLFGSLRRIACTFLAIVENRIEIASLEARQETRRLLTMLIAAGVAVACAFLGMVALTFLFVVAFWPQAIWVLLGFACFYLGITGGALLYLKKRLKEPLFPETITQLKKDRQWLFPQN